MLERRFFVKYFNILTKISCKVYVNIQCTYMYIPLLKLLLRQVDQSGLIGFVFENTLSSKVGPTSLNK